MCDLPRLLFFLRVTERDQEFEPFWFVSKVCNFSFQVRPTAVIVDIQVEQITGEIIELSAGSISTAGSVKRQRNRGK